jgi:hypothetical protein
MPITYEPIATNTLSSTASSVTFSSISGSYTDLVLVVIGHNSSGDDYTPIIRFNGDSGGNYSRTRMFGDGSSASSSSFSNQTDAVAVGTGFSTNSSRQASGIVNIMNYSNSTTYKTILTRANRADSSVYTDVNLWRNTNAITSIQLLIAGGGVMAIGTTITLYGIKAA